MRFDIKYFGYKYCDHSRLIRQAPEEGFYPKPVVRSG